MELTPQQEVAIDSDSPDILLSAGAGSGKTSTTVRRYERLLTGEYIDGRVGEPLEPASILVFTFTDKAAGELRERIRRLRDERGLAFSMGSLWVGTFHSICARILRTHAVAAAVDPSFDVIDDVIANRLKEAAYTSALEVTGEVETAIPILAGFSQFTLKKGIQSTYERLRAAGELEPKLPEPPPGRQLEEIQRDLLREALNTRANPDLKPAALQRAQNVIDALQDLKPEELTHDVLETIEIYRSSKVIPQLCAAVESAKTELLSRELGPAYWSALSDLLSNYGKAYEEAKSRRGGLDFEDLQLKTLDLLLRRPDIADAYHDQFVEIMVDEFQDTNRLQMDLIDALRGPRARLFTVGDEMQAIYGFRYADVELFRQRRAGISFRLPDDPQRRQAGERDRVHFEIEALSLNANFRSQAPVIGAVNEIGREFEALIEGLRTEGEPGGASGGTSHEFNELSAGLPPEEERPGGDPSAMPSRVEVLLTEAGAWREANLGPLAPEPGEEQYVTESHGENEAEALALAWHIRAAIDSGTPPGDIVVLLRTKTRMWLFEAALKQVGLRPYVVGGTGFWESREGVDLRALLATIANPLDDDALIGSLAGPGCGLSPSALWLLADGREKDRPLWPQVELLAASAPPEFSDEDHERAAAFVEVINDLRTRRAGIPLAELVHAAVSETGYDLVNLMGDPTGAGLANVRRVAEIAGEFEAAEGRDLRGLVTWIDDSARLDSEQAIATEDEKADVVRLMTIHKSKGLEFPMVCVADLGRQSKTNSESAIWISPRTDEPGQFEVGLRIPQPEGKTLDLYDWNQLRDRSRVETTDEELRILHVALTRAQRRLILSGVANLEEAPELTEANSHATRLTQALGLEVLEAGIETRAPDPPEGAGFRFSPARIDVTLIRPELAEDLGEVRDPEPAPKAGEPGGRPPLGRPPQSAFPEVPLSYTALADFKECPARFYATRVLRLDAPESSTEAPRRPLDPEMDSWRDVDPTAFGEAVHELLQWMSSRRWAVPSEEKVRSVLGSRGVEDDQERELATVMLEGFVKSELGERVRRSRLEAEAELLIDVDGVMIRGSIDGLVRDPEVPLVVDYKTNQLAGKALDQVMGKYHLQRDLYALAVAEALGVHEVETAYVFLRSPENPVRDRFDAGRLESARQTVSGLVGEIAGGRYLGGPEALYQPCGDCWACDLLAGQIEAAARAGSLENP